MIICDQCGKKIDRFKSRDQGKHSFCDRACLSAWRKNRRSDGELVEEPAKPKACPICSTEFTPLPSQTRVGFGKYCSRQCAGKARRKADDFEYPIRMSWYLSLGWAKLSKELRTNAVCICGGTENLEVHHIVDPFPTRDRILALDRSNLVVRCSTCHAREHRPGVELDCRRCGKKFRVNPARAEKAKYCSQTCYRASK